MIDVIIIMKKGKLRDEKSFYSRTDYQSTSYEKHAALLFGPSSAIYGLHQGDLHRNTALSTMILKI
jgi:hypothetical protein